MSMATLPPPITTALGGGIGKLTATPLHIKAENWVQDALESSV
jgi:hypothetical protein